MNDDFLTEPTIKPLVLPSIAAENDSEHNTELRGDRFLCQPSYENWACNSLPLSIVFRQLLQLIFLGPPEPVVV